MIAGHGNVGSRHCWVLDRRTGSAVGGVIKNAAPEPYDSPTRDGPLQNSLPPGLPLSANPSDGANKRSCRLGVRWESAQAPWACGSTLGGQDPPVPGGPGGRKPTMRSRWRVRIPFRSRSRKRGEGSNPSARTKSAGQGGLLPKCCWMTSSHTRRETEKRVSSARSGDDS